LARAHELASARVSASPRVPVAGFPPARLPLSLKGGQLTMCLGGETAVADVTNR
jgi:hypothetical protein